MTERANSLMRETAVLRDIVKRQLEMQAGKRKTNHSYPRFREARRAHKLAV
jgi:hypothetical protein